MDQNLACLAVLLHFHNYVRECARIGKDLVKFLEMFLDMGPKGWCDFNVASGIFKLHQCLSSPLASAWGRWAVRKNHSQMLMIV
jgi:hypothetical protein